MQTLFGMPSFFIIMTALFVQTIWLWITRKGKKEFVTDLTHFRSPTGRFSQYYRWKVSKLGNTIADAVLFEVILVVIIIILLTITDGILSILAYLPIIIFVIILSSLSSIQVAYRVGKLLAKEEELMDKMEEAEHKVGKAKEIVNGLKGEGPKGDGREWFALYKIAQKNNPIGYSVRDVLMEMQEEEVEPTGAMYQSTEGASPGDVGPGIQ